MLFELTKSAVFKSGSTQRIHLLFKVLMAVMVALIVLDYGVTALRPDARETRALTATYEFSPRRSTGVQALKLPRGISEQIQISLIFTAGSLDYPNLFQTGNSENAVRLEITQPGRLNLVLTEKNYITLQRVILMGRPYKLSLDLNDSSAEIKIDDMHAGSFKIPGLMQKIDVSNFLVGSGYSGKRNFVGTVEAFSMTYKYKPTKLRYLFGKVALIAGVLIMIVIALGTKPDHRLEPPGESGAPALSSIWIILFSALSVGAGAFAYSRIPEPGRWIGYGSIGMVLIMTILSGFKQPRRRRK